MTFSSDPRLAVEQHIALNPEVGLTNLPAHFRSSVCSTILFSLYEVLLPPASSCSITPRAIRSSISRRAVREEDFVIFIHLSLVSFPSNPLNSMFKTLVCRSFRETFRCFNAFQNSSFSRALLVGRSSPDEAIGPAASIRLTLLIAATAASGAGPCASQLLLAIPESHISTGPHECAERPNMGWPH